MKLTTDDVMQWWNGGKKSKSLTIIRMMKSYALFLFHLYIYKLHSLACLAYLVKGTYVKIIGSSTKTRKNDKEGEENRYSFLPNQPHTHTDKNIPMTLKNLIFKNQSYKISFYKIRSNRERMLILFQTKGANLFWSQPKHEKNYFVHAFSFSFLSKQYILGVFMGGEYEAMSIYPIESKVFWSIRAFSVFRFSIFQVCRYFNLFYNTIFA